MNNLEKYKELIRQLNNFWIENNGETEDANKIREESYLILKLLTTEEKKTLF